MNRITSRLIPVHLIIVLIAATPVLAGFALRINPNDRNQAQRVTIPDSRSLDINGNGITLECWLRVPRPEQDVELTFINKENTYEMKVRRNIVQMAVMTNGRWAWEGSGRIEANRWTHVAGVYDGQAVRIYINGEQQGTTARQGNINPSNDPLYIGTRPLGDFIHNYQGDIDELRVWNIARTPEQIRDKMGVMLTGDEEGLVGYWRMDEGEGQILRDRTPNENHGFMGVSPDDQRNDPVWIESDAPIRGGELLMNREEIEFGPVANGIPRNEILVLTNISQAEDDAFNVTFRFEPGENVPQWLSVEPLEGVLAPGERVDVVFTASPAEIEPRRYVTEFTFHHDAANLPQMVIPVFATVVNGAGTVAGRVTALWDDSPIGGALVQAVGEFTSRTVTDDDGRFALEELPAFDYRFLVTAVDFLPFVSDTFTIRDGDRLEFNPRLRHSEAAPNPPQVDLFMQTDDSLTLPLALGNIGNGPLTWTLDLRFSDVEGLSPWDVRGRLAAGDSAADNRIGAVQFIDDHYYVAGGNSGQAQNWIYVFDREGNIVRRFPQPAESNFGIRDLAWDGELLWGGDANEIFGFNLEGEVHRRFNDPVRPTRCIAWDPVRELLWCASVTTDIVGVNRDGEEEMRIRRIGQLRNYGLAWMPEDPEGFNLYLFCNHPDSTNLIYKVNPANGQARFVTRLTNAPGGFGGVTISGTWDPYSWTAIVVHDGQPDEVWVWQMKARTDWLTAEPTAGVVEAGEESDLALRFSTEGFPPEQEYHCEMRFTHDGIGGLTIVPVTLNTTGAGGRSQRVINLNLGWNLISVNLELDENLVNVIFRPLTERGLLHLVKDEGGRFWNPELGIDPWEWNTAEGLLVRVLAATQLVLDGVVIPADRPVPLNAGWNLVAYFPRRPIPAEAALADLGDNLVLAKDGGGHFYWPEWNFSNIGLMREGSGYALRVREEGEFVYNVDQAAGLAGRTPEYFNFTDLPPLATSFSMLVKTNPSAREAVIEALTPSGLVAGRGMVDNKGFCGMALWGDDPETPVIEGFRSGEPITLRWEGSTALTAPVSLTGVPPKWEADGWGAFAMSSAPTPFEFGLNEMFPNPFNGQMEIGFHLPSAGAVHLTVLDIAGREVTRLVKGELAAGRHRVTWNAESLASGVYILKLKQHDRQVQRKALLVK